MIFIKELICKNCPNRCKLELFEESGETHITGNLCPRGIKFALDEVNNIKKIVTGRIPSSLPGIDSILVRTSEPIPEELVFKLIRHIKKCMVTQSIQNGCIVEKNVMNLGVDLVVDDTRF